MCIAPCSLLGPPCCSHFARPSSRYIRKPTLLFARPRQELFMHRCYRPKPINTNSHYSTHTISIFGKIRKCMVIYKTSDKTTVLIWPLLPPPAHLQLYHFHHSLIRANGRMNESLPPQHKRAFYLLTLRILVFCF